MTTESQVAAATAGAEGARPPADFRTALLVFQVAGQRYALGLSDVREVLPRASLTPLPEAPNELAGILRLRGGLLPILDLRQRLGLAPAPARSGDRIVVALRGAMPVGLLVEVVEGLVPAGDMELPEPSAAASNSPLVGAVIELPGGAVMVLNAAAIVRGHLGALLAGALGRSASVVEGEPSGAVHDVAARRTWS